MLLSKSCEYAIRAAIYMASKQEAGYVPIREISNALGISFHFLTKILQSLTQGRIMISFRGPNGGISLSRPPAEIFVIDIIKMIDGDALFTDCILGLPGCGESMPCPMHEKWADHRNDLLNSFETTSLEDLVSRVELSGSRISPTHVPASRQNGSFTDKK